MAIILPCLLSVSLLGCATMSEAEYLERISGYEYFRHEFMSPLQYITSGSLSSTDRAGIEKSSDGIVVIY
ncbi:MAG: hypothetical protein PF636_11925, partial [Actinomycetota bacterium]|nr:hypothetical protein [Actinomycetota bacterium]